MKRPWLLTTSVALIAAACQGSPGSVETDAEEGGAESVASLGAPCSREKLPGGPALGVNYWPYGDGKFQDSSILEASDFSAKWAPIIQKDADHLASMNVKAVRLMLNSHAAGWKVGGTVPLTVKRPWQLGPELQNVKVNLPAVVKIFGARGIKVVVAFGQNHLTQGYRTKMVAQPDGTTAEHIDYQGGLCWTSGCRPWWEYMGPYRAAPNQHPFQGLWEFLYDARFWVRTLVQSVEGDADARANVLYYDLFNEVDFNPFYNLPTMLGSQPTVAFLAQGLWDELQSVPTISSVGERRGFSILRTSSLNGAAPDHTQLAQVLGASRVPAYVEVHSYDHDHDPHRRVNPDVVEAYDLVHGAFPGTTLVLGELGYQAYATTGDEDAAAESICERVRAASARPYSHAFHWALFDGFGGAGFGLMRDPHTPVDTFGVYVDLFGAQRSGATESAVGWQFSGVAPSLIDDEQYAAVDQRYLRMASQGQPAFVTVPGPGYAGRPHAFAWDGAARAYAGGFLRIPGGQSAVLAIRQYSDTNESKGVQQIVVQGSYAWRFERVVASAARAADATWFEVMIWAPGSTTLMDIDGFSVSARQQ